MSHYNNLLSRYADDSYLQYERTTGNILPRNPDGSWNFSNKAFEDNEVDAFRHAYVMGKLVRDGVPSSIMKIIGILHEEGSNQSARDMDLWNNSVGIGLGWRASSDDDLANLINDALNNGDLITSPRLLSDLERSEVENALKEILADLLANGNATLSGIIQMFLDLFSKGEATTPVLRYDPLTLDLDGDGIELISLSNSNTFFDLDNDGLRENVGWVKADDGILILDGNNNATVDNIEELFGYANPDGTQVTGTQELATYDSNHDSKIDNNDAVFSQLKLWQDLNQDGISQEGELKSLTDYNITSIDVNLNNLNQLNQNIEGNVIISTGTYTKEVTQTTTNANGNTVTITTEVTNQYANLDLAIDQTNSSHYDYQDNQGNNISYDLNIDTIFLPQSRGYGNTVAWHIAMSKDSTSIAAITLIRGI